MNFYAGSAFFAYFFTVTVGFITWRKANDRQLGRLFGLVSLAVSFWVLGCFGESYARAKYAYFFDVILYAGACFAPTLFLHFVLTFSEQTRRYRTFLLFNYAVSTLFLIFNLIPALRPLFIAGVPRKFPYRFIAEPNTLWYVFAAWYILPVTFLNYILYKGARQGYQNRQTTQYRYFLFAAILLAIAGSMYFALVFTFDMPPIDNFFTISYGLIMSYAILNRQFMDIRLILRDTTVHLVIALLLASGSLVAGFPLIPVNPYLALFVGTAVMGILMAVAYDPIRRLLQPAIDRIMFANRFAYLDELAQLPNDMLEFTNMRELLKFLVTRLTESANLAHAAVYMYDPAHQTFLQAYYHQNPKLADAQTPGDEAHWSLAQNTPLIQLLRRDNRFWSIQQVPAHAPPAIMDAMRQLSERHAAACFGVRRGDELVGVVILGPKVTRQQFNQQDLKILRALQMRLENFLVQAMVTTQESLNMVKDSHDMKNDVNALRGRIPMRRFQLKALEKAVNKRLADVAQHLQSGAKSPQEVLPELSAVQTKVAATAKEQLEFLPIEEDALDRLRNKLQNWSEFGRLVAEGFQGTRQIEPVDTAKVAQVCIERWRAAAERKRLRLHLQADDSLYVLGEKSLVEQILENLVDNAIKATDAGSISVRCAKSGDFVTIEVEDTGCGIPESHLPMIFVKPFYQGNGRESLEKSTGIGLVLVSQYAKSLGGEVSVESAVGKGTLFRVRLPHAKPTSQAA